MVEISKLIVIQLKILSLHKNQILWHHGLLNY